MLKLDKTLFRVRWVAKLLALKFGMQYCTVNITVWYAVLSTVQYTVLLTLQFGMLYSVQYSVLYC